MRWMRRGDMSEAIDIMRAGGMETDERQMDRLVSKASVVCMVAADQDDKAVGLLAYDVGRVSKIKIIALAVREDVRRMGVGGGLMSLVTSKLNRKRNKIELSISEYNLTAQLFLRSVGFKAVSVVDNSDGSSDYKFLYKFVEEAEREA
jgi:ribosomal protein S18 acetylase RimI-like enzyme